MTQELTLVESTALSKMAEKMMKAAKDNDETIEPGNYKFDFTVHCDGSMSRGESTQVKASFKMNDLLKAVILRYAAQYDDPESWLRALLDVDGALGAVIKLGAPAVLKSVDPDLIRIWDEIEKSSKEIHTKVAPKLPRAGNTSVVGEIKQVAQKQTRRNVGKPSKW